MPSIDELMAGLAGGDGTGHREAQQALIAAGEAAVGPLVATLLDEQSPVAWHDAGWILRQIGRPAFDPLVDALAEAPTDETRRRCGWAFVGFGEELVDDYARALSHPSPHVRENAALGLQYRKQAGLPALPALLPLLADPVADVRQRAVWAMAELGDGALPALQAIRADGPGHLRAGALQAIAEVAGDQAFTPEDRSALERLIRIKLRTDRPPAVDECGPCGPWLALPTADQQAILAELDLSDPRPATMRLGFAAFHCDRHGMADDNQRDGRVFVTPVLDGWTLVMGAWYALAGLKKSTETCRALSERFGAAQAYWFDAQTGSSSWTICARGEVVRDYDDERPKRSVGERLPVEQGLALPHEYHEEELDTCDALTVAEAMSVSPAGLGPQTTMSGHGVLALTRKGRRHGVPRGALPI